MNQAKTFPQERSLAGKRIGVFGKGGSGKSTAIVLLAKGLRDRGYEVCILDADSTNLGMQYALGIEDPPVPLLDFFGGMVFSGGRVTCPVDDPSLLPGNFIDLDHLPSKYFRQNSAGITLLTAGKIGSLGPGAGCDGPVSKIARDTRISRHNRELLTLVDLKAGFEDTARGVITNLDWAIVLVDPTVAAVDMAVCMRDTVAQIKNGKLPATHHLESLDLVAIANALYKKARIKGVLVLLNKIGSVETERYLRKRLNEQGLDVHGIIHEDGSIQMSWLKGSPLNGDLLQTDIQNFLDEVEKAEAPYSIPAKSS